MPRGLSPTNKKNIIAREREDRAFELRKTGLSYKKIGKDLGITDTAAHKAVKRVLARLAKTTEANVEDVRRFEVERLDAMLKGLWVEAELGNPAAVDRVLRIMQRRADLLGLDAPKMQKQEHSTKDGKPIQCIVIGDQRFEF